MKKNLFAMTLATIYVLTSISTCGYSASESSPQKLDEWLTSTQKELTANILPFWINHCLDEKYGGFIGRMQNDRTVVQDAPKGLVLNARILWTFSAAYRYQQKPEYLQTANRAYDYLMQYFWDKEHGGAFWMLDCRGKPTDDSKELYGQSFVIYSLAEYHLASNHAPALDKAKELFNLVEKHCHDDTNKGYYETCRRDWSIAPAARLASGAQNERKTMNTHLHLLEAYTNLYRAWKNEKLRQRLEELIAVFANHIIDPQTWHFKLFFDEKWNSTKSIVSYGHDIEGTWLLCEAADVLGDKNLQERIKTIALKMADAALKEGLDKDGGLLYEGEHDKITNAQKHWWPQAEAVVGFLNAYQLSKKDGFLEASQRCWQFTQANIVDKQNGEWFAVASERGISPSAMKVSEWKGPYHNGRACLEIIRKLKEIRN